MSKNSKIFYFIIVLMFFIFADFMLTDVILNYAGVVKYNPILSIFFVENNGAAFNIFEGFKEFLIIFSAAAFGVIVFYTIKHISCFKCKYLFLNAMLSAGIFCNMLERLVYGHVRDYIKLNFMDFPVFNISDILINISVLSIIVLIMKNKYTKNNEINS